MLSVDLSDNIVTWHHEVLRTMGTPSPKEYRRFHNEADKNNFNDEFRTKYRELANLKMVRGRSTGKSSGMRDLCRLWLLAKQEALQKGIHTWESQYVTEVGFSEQKDTMKHSQVGN